MTDATGISGPLVLAVDVGGTKTHLGVYDATTTPPTRLDAERFPTTEFDGLVPIINRFLGDRRLQIAAAGVGVAGPVRDRSAQLTNVDWGVSAPEIEQRCVIPRVHLLNDVAAAACAVPALRDDQVDMLQAGVREPGGAVGLMSVGTGLGEAILADGGDRSIPLATEAGHSDFAARTPREIELVTMLSKTRGRVSCEDVMSGPGLARLYRFTHADGACSTVPATMPESDRPRAITTSALSATCARCVEAMELFVEALGAEAGNLGLRAATTGGLYLGGGIPRKIVPALRWPHFLAAFNDKPPMDSLLHSMPVGVITDPDAPLLGAAMVAQQLLSSPATRTRSSGITASGTRAG